MNDLSDWQELEGAAIWARHRGEVEDAVKLMSEAICAAKHAGVPQEQIASMLNYYADILLLKGDYNTAEKTIREAFRHSEVLGISQAGDDLFILSNILDAKGDLAAALDAAERSLSAYNKFGHQHGAGQAQLKIDALLLKIKE